MTIARATVKLFIGTSDSVGTTITTGSVGTSGEVDLTAGNDTSLIIIAGLYLKFTSTVTAGSVDVRLWPSGVTTVQYLDQAVPIGAYSPISGTQRIAVLPKGAVYIFDRFANASVTNNATGASITNVYLWANVYQIS